MAFEFRLADLAEGMVEGEVLRWLVNEGDTIKEDQPLVEVMTDKATVEIASPKAGRVAKIKAPAGQICKVGAVLVEIDTDGSSASAAAPAAPKSNGHANGSHGSAAHAQTAAIAAVAPPPRIAAGKVLATPATRKLARELGVDLSTVRATGENGRVTKDDVRSARGGGAPASAPSMPSYAPISIARDVADERVPFRGVRKKIADNLMRSKLSAADFTYVEECDVTELSALRKRAKVRAEERGIKLSFLPFIVKAVVAALKKYPIVNSTLDEAAQEVVLRKRYHVGIAAATSNGLTVPVVKDADQKSLFQIAAEIEQLAEKAKSGKASREELTGSTFTISSLGSLGGLLATPVINFPEVAVLGVHKIKPMPVVRDGQIVIREIMNLSITLDHRIVDGYEGAMFLQHVVEQLQDPTLMFMEMV